jgi:guanylate kinase
LDIPTVQIGTLFVVSAPSGAGKTSLVRELVHSRQDLLVSVSHTTRSKRPGEIEAVHYHFVSDQQFSELTARNAFLEQATVFGHRYGTSKEWVAAQLNKGLNIVLEIDWQGAAQVRDWCADCVTIFILPPSRQSLQARLRGRGQDSDEVIQRRLSEAGTEIQHFDDFNYVLVNDNFDLALEKLEAILVAECLKREKQAPQMQALLKDLLA